MLIYVYLYDYDNIYEKLQIVVDELSSLTYKNRNNCVVCGNKAPLNRYKDVLIPIDDKCIDKLNNEEIENINTISLFPNPTSEFISISAKKHDIDKIELFGTDGRIVKTQKLTHSNEKVDVRNLTTGIYYIKIYENDIHLKTLRFIKK